MRLRIGPAIKGLVEHGENVTFGEVIVNLSDKVVVTKIGGNNIQTRQVQWLEQIEHAKRSGAKIFLDYTDHHLGFESSMSDFYRNVLCMVDVVVTSSRMMKQNLAKYYSGKIELVEDAIECLPQTIKPVNKPITFLWFGHASNIEYLISFIKLGFRAGDQIRLIILSNQVGLEYFSKVKLISEAEIQIQLAIWSQEAMVHASKLADACIIPINNADLKKNGASSNRLITALALGLPVAAGALDSYKDFKKYYVDIDSEEFRSLIQDPAMFHDQVKLAQLDVVPKYSIRNLSSKWVELLA
ncbi:hypothetical protein [Polynucleobacter ibericus]|uniref:hypothetical protein n=1 Tax=Polynucleobacter ibericus TaxID=1819725 RepID=UPI001BFCF986|nr:hypothetical protein [Polynucleobacter ibericus]QWE08438.1 hypothetical protein AOC20_08455 [Polynucleobacter ibericus]